MAKKRSAPPPVEPSRPGGENTDPDVLGLGVTVVRSANGGAYFLPRSITRLTGEAEVTVHALQEAATHRAQIDEDIEQLVSEARELGVSWAAIGWSVGTTGEAARQRWGP
jgi:hypothetical protein